MNAATDTVLTVSDLQAMGQLTEARTAMIDMGCIFFAEPRGGGVYYTGKLTDAQWDIVDAAAARDQAAREAALQAARPQGELCPGTNGF